MQLPSVRQADVNGKRVLVRADFDVPLVEGKVGDDFRLRAAVPTLELLHKNGAASITILAHVGRPKGVDERLRVAPVAARLRELTQVPFAVQENLRFSPSEEQNDPAFAKELASLGDVFINEAFADSHRAHASIVGVPKILPSFAGLRFEEEVQKLSEALTPPKGALAIMGGAKFETKQPLIEALLVRYEKILLGGALGNDMLKARGLPVGSSLVSDVPVSTPVASNPQLVVPRDIVVRASGNNSERTALVSDVQAGEEIVDIGPKTHATWGEEVKRATFVLWNGPMGVYEKGFVRGTDAIAQALSGATTPAVVGGGDTLAALAKGSLDTKRVFLSTGGGAMLEFLSTGTLLGIRALQQ